MNQEKIAEKITQDVIVDKIAKKMVGGDIDIDDIIYETENLLGGTS